MIRSGKQTGYILLPVIVVITLVAAIALLMNTESALESNTAGSELDAQQAQYVAEAGLNHALWLNRQQGCGPYSDLTDEPLGNDKYTSNLTTDLGSTTGYSSTVDQDTWIKSNQPDVNKGSDGVLHVGFVGGDSERPLLRFDLSSIPAKAAILSATAWFYVDQPHPEGPVDIHRITADWLEIDATWNTMNANMDSAVIASIPPQPTIGVWVAVNLTSQVQAWINGQSNYGITLNSTSEGVDGRYDSRESANAPYLEVIVGAPPSSPAVLKSIGTLGNGVTRSLLRTDIGLIQSPMQFLHLQPDAANGFDTYLDQSNPGYNNGISDDLWLENAGGSNDDHVLLKFTLGRLPVGARIESATLQLFQNYAFTSGGEVGIHRLRRDWEEGNDSFTNGPGATWNNATTAQPWTVGGGEFDSELIASATIAPSTTGYYSWDITRLVQAWTASESPNDGMLIKSESTGSLLRFSSSDHATEIERPRLAVTFSCECGVVCVGPQGSGNLLMAVINPTTLVAEDQKAKDLFESWGYTVSVIGESANQISYDAAVAINDVVFISETVNSNAVGTKLKNAPIGVVSQDGDYNPDLGFSESSALTVGNAIDIVSTDHFITQPFAIGPLEIYSASMEQLTVAGDQSGDLNILAESSGDGSLVVLDTGDALEDGGNAAGRRVMLPLGTRYRFNWDYLNANGRLLVQRALEWGIGDKKIVTNEPTILSTASGATLGGLTFTDKDLAEYDRGADNATLYLDGVALSLAQDIDAVHVLANGHIVLSAINTITLGGITSENEDLIDYDPVADSADLIFDGSALFTSGSTDISAVHVMDNGRLLLTNEYTATLGGLSFGPNDIVEYDPATNTATLFFDGDAVGFSAWINAVHLLADGNIVLSTDTSATLGSLSFDPGDLIEYDPVADSATLFLDGALFAASENVRSAHVGPGSGDAYDASLPFAYWKLDDAAGPTAIDSIGGHDGTLSGLPAWTTGQLDGALDFDGVDDYVDAGTFDVPGTGLTMMGWFNAETISTDDGRIISKADGPNATDAWWQLSTTDSGADRYLRMRIKAGGTTTTFADSSANLVPGQWYFAVGTYDNASGDMKLYLDGAEIASGTHAVGGALDTGPTVPVAIGANGTAERFFDGILDDVRIYNRALSAAEIAELAGQTGPIAHWKLDETSGFNAEDSASDNDGTLSGGNDWTPAVIDGGLDFDGSNDYVDVGTFDVSGSGITMMGWFNAEAIATDDGRIVSKANGPNATDAWWQLSTTDSGANRYLRMRIKAGGTTTTMADSTVNLSTSQWYFAVATYSNATGEMKLYLDGTEIRSGSHAVGGPVDTDAAVAVAIGANGTAERFFNGILDDVRVYDYALNASEISDLYGANAPLGPSSYTEMYQPWSATSDITWQSVDLGAFGVPANAVVEVAITNAKDKNERWGGVRAVGSSLDRRFQLHESEGGGVDAITLHVQADSSSRIEHYSEKKAELTFTLLGYWTGASYVELYEPFTADNSNTWVEEDLGDDGLGPNQIAEIVMLNTNQGAERLAGVRPSGASYQRRFNLHEAESGGVDAVTMMTSTDASTIAEVFATNAADVDFYVVGYWSTPPGTYTETGGVHGQASAASTWEQADLAGFGVPADSVAQFVISSEIPNFSRELGVREVGSGELRVIDLHKAEAGGSEDASLHVNVDSAAKIEWYSSSGTSDRYFYPVGWWVLSP